MRGLAKLRRQSRGIALVTVLVMTVILLVLTVAFLFYAERGYRFAGLQERQNQAYFLALSGLEYYKARPEEFIDTPSRRRPVPIDSTTDFFEVVLRSDGTIESTGILESTLTGISGNTTITRTIIVPGGDLEKMYDSSQDL